MQSISLPVVTAALLAMSALAGCQTGQHQNQAQHSGMAMPAGGAANVSPDMSAMCAGMHEKMMAAKSPEERRALMQEYMKSMPPEMPQRMHQHMASMSPEQRQKMHEHMESMCQ
jgi:uncharacterized protein YggE